MREILTFAIVAIALLSVVLIANEINKSYQDEQSAKLQSEAEQSAKIQFEVEQSEKLQAEAEQHVKLKLEAEQQEKLDYEEMCQHIEEIGEQLESVSKKLISVYEEFGYDRAAVINGFYNNKNSDEWLEYESLIDSLNFMREIDFSHNNAYSFVFFRYPTGTAVYGYCDIHSEYHYFNKNYVIIYIPDEYIDEETIAAMNEKNFFDGDLQHVKDNLFTVWFWDSPC